MTAPRHGRSTHRPSETRLRPLAGLGLTVALLTGCGPDPSPPADVRPALDTRGPSTEPGAFVFAARRDGGSAVWVQPAVTSEPARRLTVSGRDNWPVFSRDGRALAFQSQRDGNYEIYVLPAEGGVAVNLTRHPEHDGLPVFSPDGGRIAFFSSRGLEPSPRALPGNLYVVPLDGSTQPVRVTETPLGSTLGPSDWSPDGERLLFSRLGVDSGRTYLVELGLADGAEHPLPVDGPASSGTYSPDGRWIAYTADRGERSDIVLIDRAGGEPRVLTPDPGLRYYPAFSPDGAWIAFTVLASNGDTDLAGVSVETGEIRSLLATPEHERELRWLPKGRSPADLLGETAR